MSARKGAVHRSYRRRGPRRLRSRQGAVPAGRRALARRSPRNSPGATEPYVKWIPLVVPLLFRIGAVRRLLFKTVSQTQVNYRDSALSAGAAGRVRGGDRLPWVELEPGEDNFAPLTSLDWQVHVYGEAGSGVRESCAELRLPLHVFAWQQTMRRAGLQKGALYLVRPDGYVALADPSTDPQRLRQYLTELGLRGEC